MSHKLIKLCLKIACFVHLIRLCQKLMAVWVMTYHLISSINLLTVNLHQFLLAPAICLSWSISSFWCLIPFWLSQWKPKLPLFIITLWTKYIIAFQSCLLNRIDIFISPLHLYRTSSESIQFLTGLLNICVHYLILVWPHVSWAITPPSLK